MDRKIQGQEGVLLIAAGGTIAAEPYLTTPKWVTVKTNARVIAEMGRLSDAKLEVKDFAIKDSKKVTKADMAQMADIIAQAEEECVIVTHGTDGMRRNARVLKEILAERYPEVLASKNIVFTGAMEPLANGAQSDGYQNLKDALEVVLHNARHGVSIVMHRQVFDPARVTKNFAKKAFYEKPERQR